MTVWWYEHKQSKIGPVGTEEIRSLLQTEKITKETMLWKEGMENWMALGDVDELRTLVDAVPPPLPRVHDRDASLFPPAGAWRRFYARLFDLWLLSVATGAVLGAILGQTSGWFIRWMAQPGSAQQFGMLCIPIALMLDTLFFRMFGNTPGKALLGLHVRHADGTRLSFANYGFRNLRLWWGGLGLGVPVVNLFTMAHQHGRLKKMQYAGYDEKHRHIVHAKPIGWMRKLSFAVLFIITLVGLAVANVMDREAVKETTTVINAPSYAWINPLTNISADVAGQWKSQPNKNVDGQDIFVFSEPTEHAVVIFGVEQLPALDMQGYVGAFQKNTSTQMHFRDGGRFESMNGKTAWHGSGTMDDPNNQLNVEIRQDSNGHFWRVVRIQSRPYSYSDEMTSKLQQALWQTLK